MTSLIKNQVLKHLTKFFKDLAPEQLQLSAFKGSCELSNLQLEEKVLMELLSFPAWLGINKATCDQLYIKIPWTKIKSVPIQMSLNEVSVEVEVCDEFRNVDSTDDLNLANIINTAQAPGKYGFVDRVIDGITVTVNNVLITFKSKLMSATFNLSRVVLESRCPNWKPGELSLTRIKDTTRGQILLFKIVEWQTMRLEAKCLTDPQQAPLRLITNHAQCRVTIKKQLDDCSVSAARIFVIFEDILWVLTFAQFVSAAAFVEYIFTLIKRSPMSKKNNLCENKAQDSGTTNLSSNSISHQTSFNSQQAPIKSPLNASMHSVHVTDKPTILTGNMSSASLLEQKFICYDLVETSLHLYIDKVDAHLYDDIEISAKSSSRDSGGALQTTLDQIQVDCYPYSRAISDRKHWYKWFDPSPNSRRQWLNSHFAEFDMAQLQRNDTDSDGKSFNNSNPSLGPERERVPCAINDQLLSLTVLVKIKDYCMNCVATKDSNRNIGLNKFIQTDKDYHMPSEMPSLYLELNYFYYFDAINRMMIYEDVPDPLAFMHLSPTKLLFDTPTLVFLNSFQVNLSKAFVHLNDLFPVETTAPRIHCRIEILMPQVSLPAKSSKDQSKDTKTGAATSALLIKSGKVILCNSIYDKDMLWRLMESIDKLRESPSTPINLGGSYHSSPTKKDTAPSFGDWSEIWNASLINNVSAPDPANQLWTLQFEPVWMDFMNHDVDDLASSQRLEPIVEPVNASAYIHLRLGPHAKVVERSNAKVIRTEVDQKDNNRNTISILVSVMDGPILANMDKVQFSFLQRLGMQVERLLQQIREDASTLIQMETTFEDTLELNLTAYIKEIKARLILNKTKIDAKQKSIDNPLDNCHSKEVPTHESDDKVAIGPDLSTKNNLFTVANESHPKLGDPFSALTYTSDGCNTRSVMIAYDNNLEEANNLDECIEVAEDASCLLLSDSGHQETVASEQYDNQSNVEIKAEKPPTDDLLINLDEIEQAASLFAKVVLNPSPAPSNKGESTEQEDATESPNNQHIQHDTITETVSYLELSMSQLMVRRITETKRRQKF